MILTYDDLFEDPSSITPCIHYPSQPRVRDRCDEPWFHPNAAKITDKVGQTWVQSPEANLILFILTCQIQLLPHQKCKWTILVTHLISKRDATKMLLKPRLTVYITPQSHQSYNPMKTKQDISGMVFREPGWKSATTPYSNCSWLSLEKKNSRILLPTSGGLLSLFFIKFH